ncbi:hypothetical protein OIU85_009649 [Salix viminalis]|uniref:CRAL-TRIO domain-containing protein n=1 Tax=Salix viminalis TaxID=40686 RepID=A0A9Q0SFY8_SALVM|nr:hypothetical protein OIU85_009649 [Salix viminalis]
MLLRYLKWRREFVPNGSISPLETPNEVAQNKMFLQGSDKKGCPITVILGARHFQSKGGLEEFKRFVVYGFDKICSRMTPGQEKLVVIGDLKGWGYVRQRYPWIPWSLPETSRVQEYYPERLAKDLAPGIAAIINSQLLISENSADGTFNVVESLTKPGMVLSLLPLPSPLPKLDSPPLLSLPPPIADPPPPSLPPLLVAEPIPPPKGPKPGKVLSLNATTSNSN